jgi:hypothetical protein
MDDFYKVAAIATAAFVVVMGLWTAVRLRRERPFSALAVLVAGVGPVATLAVFSLMLDVDLKPEAAWGLLAGGAAVGLLAGRSIPIFAQGPGVFTRASGWHLLPPVFAIAAIQVTGVRESSDGVVRALGGLYAATGFTVAASALLLVRRQGIRPAAVPAEGLPAAIPAAEGQRCPRCGSPVRSAWRHCMGCGAPV